jgi:hypothetical protein
MVEQLGQRFHCARGQRVLLVWMAEGVLAVACVGSEHDWFFLSPVLYENLEDVISMGRSDPSLVTSLKSRGEEDLLVLNLTRYFCGCSECEFLAW